MDKFGAGPLRFTTIKQEIPAITERTLTLQLKAFENDGLIKGEVYLEVPLRVEYRLTEIAEEFVPIFYRLNIWGQSIVKRFNWPVNRAAPQKIRLRNVVVLYLLM